MTGYKFPLSLTILLVFFINVSSAQLKVCAFEDVTEKSDCSKAESNGDIKCVWVTDSVDCALKMISQEVDAGGFTAEQILLVGEMLDTYATLYAEVRNEDRIGEKYAFKSVAIVRNFETSENWRDGIRRKRFCHPGYKYEHLWSKRVINEFENVVVPKICTNKTKFADEDDIHSAANFFGDSCRPGPWIDGDEKRDKELKRKYPSLCKSCENSAECDYRSSSKGSHKLALECLTSGRGDITYVNSKDVIEHFKNVDDKSRYKYLCRDGSTQNIEIQNILPCNWVQQRWPAILVLKGKADELNKLLEKNSKSSFEYILTRRDGKPIKLENTSPTQYVKERLDDITETKMCRNEIKWCTVNEDEKEKCDVLKRASKLAGVVPTFDCIRGSDLFDCFLKIKNGNADLISVDSNYGYLTRKHYNMAPVFYPITMNEKSFVVALIKETSKNDIRNFSQMKNKKACFPEYGGIAWISFVMAGRQSKVLSKRGCNYKEQVGSFFGESCAPGARSPTHYIVGRNDKYEEKLCSLCPKSGDDIICDISENNIYFGNKGAVICLTNGTGDVAFVEKFSLTELSLNENEYRVVCKNNTLATYPGLNVDENCALSVTIDSEVLTRKDDANDPYFEVFLKQLEKWFGIDSNRQQTTMHMFKRFRNTSDLLFKENVIGFDDTNNPDNKYTTNYRNLFKSVEECPSGAISNIISIFTIQASLLILLSLSVF